MSTHEPSISRRRGPAALALLAGLALGACDEGPAWGDVNSIIVAADPALWAEVQDTVEDALEPRILTVRDERTFRVTYQDPQHELWGNLRKFRQMLLIGTGEEPWLREAIEEMDQVPEAPAVVQVGDVWARGQQVTVLLVPPGNEAEAVRGAVSELNELLDRQFREYAVSRMFTTGRDSALADTLWREAGFFMLLPKVYYWDRQDSVVIFRNDNPDPAELIRQVMVTWRSPVPQGMQPEGLLEWRKEIASEYYSYPQDVNLDVVSAGPFQYRGHEAYQIQATWENPPEADWPAAGPFVLRSVICREQDRMYLIDGWLYAPGKDKYEYMIQLETILDSFRCGTGRGAGASSSPPADGGDTAARGPRGPADTTGGAGG